MPVPIAMAAPCALQPPRSAEASDADLQHLALSFKGARRELAHLASSTERTPYRRLTA